MSNFKYSLEICSQKNLGAVYPLNRTENIVGRGDVDVSIDNSTLSENHCLIRQNGKHLTVTDLQSRNGTIVNSKKILHETSLSSGDVLTLGEVSFRLTAANTKKRLSSVISPHTNGRTTSIFQKLITKFPNRNEVKSTYEKTSSLLSLLLVVLSWVILLCPLYIIMHDQVTKSSLERACSLVSSLAASNIEAMEQKNQLMVNTSIIDKDPGVKMALIMTNQGIVWAPQSLLNKKASDTYGKHAIAADQLFIQQRGNGLLDITLPIKTYDYKNDRSLKIGIARIIYDPKSVGSGPNPLLVVALCSIVYIAVVMYFSRKVTQTVKQDIFSFQEDCEDVIKGNVPSLQERYSPEFNGLAMTFNRLLRKLGKSAHPPHEATDDINLKQLTDMVSGLEQAALLIDSRNVVSASNTKVHGLFDCAPEAINGKSMLEIQCEKDFYQGLLEFVCTATQDQEKTKTHLTTRSGDVFQAESIPILKGYCLVLLTPTVNQQTG